jgi:hypothetical protein
VNKADNLPTSCAVVTKSGNHNFLEPSGPLQACNGTDLPLPLYWLSLDVPPHLSPENGKSFDFRFICYFLNTRKWKKSRVLVPPYVNTTVWLLNPLTPNDHYSGLTSPLTSKLCILYIYSTNIGTEYFKHGIYSPFFSSKCSLFHNSNAFVSCIIHILYTGCAKIKKNFRRQKINGKYLSGKENMHICINMWPLS